MKKVKVRIGILESQNRLSEKNARLLKEIIRKNTEKAGALLGVSMINVTIYPNANFTTKETGEGGYTPSKDWFHLYIDPKRKGIDKIIKKIIPATIYHEMNHAARWKYTGYGKNLLGAIITEGLATVFAEEQWEKFKAPWADFSEKEINNLLSIFKKRKKTDDASYNHGEWFYRQGKIPRWAGYKIGTHIVRSFKEKNKKFSWKQITKMKADKIIKMSKINLG